MSHVKNSRNLFRIPLRRRPRKRPIPNHPTDYRDLVTTSILRDYPGRK